MPVMKDPISVETPAGYTIPKEIALAVPEIIRTMAAVTGLWAGGQFVDGTKTMLGWMSQDRWRESSGTLKAVREFAERVRGEKRSGRTTDIVFIGQGGSIECIKTLYNIFGSGNDAPCVHIVDTVDQEVIAGLKNRLPLEKTRFIILSKSMTTMEVHSLYKLFYDLYDEKVIHNRRAPLRVPYLAKEHFTLITDQGKAGIKDGALIVAESVRNPFREEVLARGFSDVFYIEPCSGGRYSWDTAVGILPAFIMQGANAQKIIEGANVMEVLAKTEGLGSNPAAQYGVFKYMMQLQGRNRPTLVLPEEIAAYGPWAGQLDTESLGKAPDKSSITIDHEIPADDMKEYTNKRFFVRIRAGEGDSRFDAKVRDIEKSKFPVITITLPNSSPKKIDPEDLGSLLKMSEFATVIAGYLMGINPVNQPGVEAYKKAQNKYLEEGPSGEDLSYIIEKGSLKLNYEAAMTGKGAISKESLAQALKRLGSDSPAAIYAALLRLAAGERGRDYAVMMVFKKLTPQLQSSMNLWRYGVRKTLRIDTLSEEAPCILHAKQQGFQDGEKSGFFTIVRFAEYGNEKIVIPGSKEAYGSERTFADLIKAQAAGTLSALSAAGQSGVMIELKDTEESTITGFTAFIKDSIDYLNRSVI
jgi:transaldolase/glucose-6-phosphate isomerase